MIITVSGFPKSGTSSVATGLVDSIEGTVEHINGGDIFRARAEHEGMELKEFSKHVNENPQIDREIDGTMRAIVRAFATDDYRIDTEQIPLDTEPEDVDHLLLESRLAGWIAGNFGDCRVWLDASPSLRQQRARFGSESKDDVIDRAWDERMRYQMNYDIDIDDTTLYDLTIDTATWDESSIVSSITSFVDSYDSERDNWIEEQPSSRVTKQFDSVIPERLYV